MHATRPDLSEWVLHFVHDRNPNNEPVIDDGQGTLTPIPYCVSDEDPNAEPHEINPRDAMLGTWDMKEAETELEPDAAAMQVLLKILDDGGIRGGWAMRGGKPTIYGYKAACCFTEMPLYALMEYAKRRADDQSVRPYAVGLPRRELFRAGTRHVIYGVSTEHKEKESRTAWPRLLADECGIAEHEQYRYVATKLHRDPPMDWTHEREWRWCDVENRCSCPGLPIWLAGEPVSFSSIFVLVPSAAEAAQVLEKLQEMLDAGSDGYDHPYRKAAIRATRVLSLDEAFANKNSLPSALRLDDINWKQIETIQPTEPSTELLAKLPSVIAEAEKAAALAAAAYASSGHHLDVFGTADLVIDYSRSELAQAVLRIGKGLTVSGIGCFLRLEYKNHTGLLGEAEAAMEAAESVLRLSFATDTFHVRSAWD